MTSLKGDLRSIMGTPFGGVGHAVLIFSRVTRAAFNSDSVVLQLHDRIEMPEEADGKFHVDGLDPGPIRIELEGGTVHNHGWNIDLPDEGVWSLTDLVDAQVDWSPAVIGRAEAAAREARDHADRAEAGADRVGTAEQVGAWASEARASASAAASAESGAIGARDASQSARDAAEGHANRAATSESNAAASESAAKQAETNAGDFAAVATTAATEAVDAMEVASQSVSSIGDSVSRAAASADSASQSESNAAQYESSAATHAQNATEAAEKVGTAAELDEWARAAQEAADRVGTAEQVGTWASESSAAASRAAQSESNAKASEESASSSAIDAKASEDAASGSAIEAGSHAESLRENADQVQAARDEVVPLAGQVAADASATAAHRVHVDNQVSAIDTAFTDSIPPYLQPDAGGGLQEIYGRGVHVKTFGAVGDGVADDTAAIRAAIRSGQPLYWGDNTDVYRITDTVSANISHPLTWRSDGAKILCDPLEPVRRALYVAINNEPVSIDGPLTIDANRKAFDGFTLESVDAQVDADITGLEVSNVYRSSNLYAGGNGMRINGAFSTLTLNRPIVRSVTVASGATQSEQDGVAGITVAAFDSMRYARDIQINAPFVDGVYSEDTTNHHSQNGIRIYGPSDASAGPTSFPMKFVINGGTISNAGGRAVKLQCEWGVIDGLTIIRDTERAIGKSDIDFQRGGGQITNLSVKYAGNAAASVIKFSGAVSSEKTVPHGSVAGMKVEISGAQVPDTIVNLLQDVSLESYVVVTDAEVVGEQPPYFLTLNGTEGTVTHASLNSIYAAPGTALVRGAGGTSLGWTGAVGAVNITNTGADKKPFFQSSSGPRANPEISVANVHGFTGLGIETTALLKTVESTSNGWNDLMLESGLGSVYAPSYFRPPAGTYRISYIGRTEPFERHTQQTGRGTLTPVNGLVTEIIQFEASDYFRIPGSMTDLSILFEFLF